MIALVASIVVGCGPSTSEAQPGSAEGKPCAKSPAKLDLRFHAARAAMFSAAVSVRQEDQLHVVVVDLVDRSVCSLGTWATANVDDVYVGEDRTLLVVDAGATYVVRDGVTSKGPRLPVYRVLFARRGAETRIIAWLQRLGTNQLGDTIVDLTEPDKPRQIASFGGSLLGQLDDGTILVSDKADTNPSLALRALALDGTVTTLATVSSAHYALELHRKPRLEVTVAVPGSELGFYDVVTVDLSSGTQAKTGRVPIVPSEATGRPSPDDAFVARNTRELPVGLRITTPAGEEILAMHVATSRGGVSFRGWVRR